MNKFKLYRIVISMLGVMVCALSAALFVILNGQDAPSNREIAAAPVAEPASEPAPKPADARSLVLRKNPEPSPVPPGGVVPNFVPKPVDAIRLQALQKKFETISAQKEPDIGEIDALFAELIEIQGTSVIAGIDLNVQRQNLRIARDLQQIAKEMDAEYKKPAPDVAKMENLRRKAAALQNQFLASLHGQPATAGIAPFSGSGR
ncbi:MAG: hypothetical protein LBU11_01925 [Zoogloeaceae bacterium]|jgi:hypothetical protein|nr:hypothetical protein [Zoogloeaceae bacterium]